MTRPVLELLLQLLDRDHLLRGVDEAQSVAVPAHDAGAIDGQGLDRRAAQVTEHVVDAELGSGGHRQPREWGDQAGVRRPVEV